MFRGNSNDNIFFHQSIAIVSNLKLGRKSKQSLLLPENCSTKHLINSLGDHIVPETSFGKMGDSFGQISTETQCCSDVHY